MSRAIKVEDQVYEDLDQLRSKGETFSQVIEGFLKTRQSLYHFLDVLEGQTKYHEHKEKRLRELEAANRERDSSQVPNLQSG
jgi:predicted CopG family antitoxin